MWTENAVFKEDLDDLDRCSFLPWSRLRGKTVLITGGTGLIGYTLTCALLYHEALHREGLRAVLLVRDKARAEAQYAAQIEEGCALSFVGAELEKPLSLDIPVDYILHAAAPTASIGS